MAIFLPRLWWHKPRARAEGAARVGIDCRKILDYGIGTITANLIENLAAIDSETSYFLFGDPDVVGVKGPNFTTIKETTKRYSIRESIRLPGHSQKLDLDLLHWLHYATSPIKRCKYVVSIHDINHLLLPELLSSRVHRKYAEQMLRLSARVADRIITASNSSKKEIIEHLHVPEEKVAVIHNGVSEAFKELPSDEVTASLRSDFGLESPYILYVGSLREHKNVRRLLEAFEIARKRLGNNLSLVIAGEHRGQKAALSEFAEQRRMTECVRFLGGVAHDMLPVLYSGAMVFVFPTLYEGFGLPPLEAMASGTPVCLSRIPVLEEVAGDAAAYFNPEDIFDIADKLVSVLLDSERHKALREAGLERARRFSWRRAAEETLRVYREVLGQ